MSSLAWLDLAMPGVVSFRESCSLTSVFVCVDDFRDNFNIGPVWIADSVLRQGPVDRALVVAICN